MIRTYEVDQPHKTFAHSIEELRLLSEEAVMLLRCCADGSGLIEEFGRSIEQVALELDLSLFVTLLARMWAQNVMLEQGEVFETVRSVLLEAALRLEEGPRNSQMTDVIDKDL